MASNNARVFAVGAPICAFSLVTKCATMRLDRCKLTTEQLEELGSTTCTLSPADTIPQPLVDGVCGRLWLEKGRCVLRLCSPSDHPDTDEAPSDMEMERQWDATFHKALLTLGLEADIAMRQFDCSTCNRVAVNGLALERHQHYPFAFDLGLRCEVSGVSEDGSCVVDESEIDTREPLQRHRRWKVSNADL